MAELTISTLIKIILGLVVVVAVVIGLYLAFKNSIIGFFKNVIPSGNGSVITGGVIWGS